MVVKDRITAKMEGEFVLFLIGMRFNALWKIHQWLPVFFAMPRMIAELKRHPELGLLGAHVWFGRTIIVVQYWRSFAELEAYARSRDSVHLPAWASFNKRVGVSGDVGIWHETYVVGPGQYENIYVNMPRFGLGGVGRRESAVGENRNAAERLRPGSPAASPAAPGGAD